MAYFYMGLEQQNCYLNSEQTWLCVLYNLCDQSIFFFFQMKFWLLFPFLWLPIACKITLETQANTEDPSWLPFICFQLYSKLHLLPILLSFLPAFLKFSIGNYPSSHCCCCCSAAKSCLTLQPHELQHAKIPCPSLSPRVCSNSCPLSQWCHPAISSSVTLLSFCSQSFPASGSFLLYSVSFKIVV